MQEVFEKIIKKLEELRKAEIEREDLCDEEGCGDGEEIYEDGKSQGRFEQVVRIIEIVKQEAEKYNNEWVPVSERMPDVCGYPVLLTVENAFGQRRVCKAFTNYMKEGELLFYTNEKEYCQQLTSSILSESWKPIAWMNLPAPYQPKGE